MESNPANFKTMKKLLPFLFLLTSCSKVLIEPKPEKPTQFTAILSINPTSKTLYYDLFASNDKNALPGYWLWIGRVQANEIKNGKASFEFNAPIVCGVTIEKNKPVYGCSREVVYGNIMMEINYESVVIK
ncbi:MAG: hypothetical protein JWO92_2500 [Chitinophagaceae bacterium]|nr:hypothetical protein [Chitinophagaceae bacterium]